MAENKPTIDERLEALATSLELLSVNVHALQEKSLHFTEWQQEMDGRERRGRRAILVAMQAYLRELDGEANGAQE